MMLAIALGLYSLWPLHKDTETETFFEFFSVAEALLRCRRIVIVAKQENCHVPSSALKYSCHNTQKSSGSPGW